VSNFASLLKAEHSVRRYHEGCEMATLVLTGFTIFLFFPFYCHSRAFLGGKFLQDLLSIRHVNVNNGISRSLLKASNQQITSIGIQKTRRRGSTWHMRFGTIGTHRSRLHHRFASGTEWAKHMCR